MRIKGHIMILMDSSLQSLTGLVQGQNRVFPVEYFPTEKNLFSLAGIPVMKTGFSLLEILHRENPVLITGMGLQFCFEVRISSKNKYNVIFSTS